MTVEAVDEWVGLRRPLGFRDGVVLGERVAVCRMFCPYLWVATKRAAALGADEHGDEQQGDHYGGDEHEPALPGLALSPPLDSSAGSCALFGHQTSSLPGGFRSITTRTGRVGGSRICGRGLPGTRRLMMDLRLRLRGNRGQQRGSQLGLGGDSHTRIATVPTDTGSARPASVSPVRVRRRPAPMASGIPTTNSRVNYVQRRGRRRCRLTPTTRGRA